MSLFGGLTGSLLGGAALGPIGSALGFSKGSNGSLTLPGQSTPTPPTTDYTNAAIAQQLMSNANYSTPFGSQTWDYSKTYTLPNGQKVPIPSSTTSFSPQAQSLYNLAQSNVSGMPSVGDQYKALGGMPTFNNDYVKQQQDAIMGRLQPGMDQAREQYTAQLANQGITATSNPKAFNDAMLNFNQGQNDQLMNAQIQAANQGSQMYQNQLAGRQQGVNEIGSMYNLGTQQALQPLSTYQSMFNMIPTQAGMPSNYLTATQAQGQQAMNQYNQNIAQQNATQQGLFGLGAAGLLAFA